jgi:hypothetical protein
MVSSPKAGDDHPGFFHLKNKIILARMGVQLSGGTFRIHGVES